MANIFDLLLDIEGGYVNDPNDPGCETNFGISKKSYPNVDIKNLTRSQAIAIYNRDYYLKYRVGEIENHDVEATLLIALVHGGQGMYNYLEKQFNSSDLIATLNSHDDDTKLRLAIVHRYINLTDQNKKLGQYLRGWIKRRIFYEL
jgi:lysozyme family protein